MKSIMKRAWEICRIAAKKFGHSVKSYLKMALKAAWAEAKAGCLETVVRPVIERIDELTAKGFKRWTKGNLDRLYINASQLGLDCSYYNTGNISGADFQGERISNRQAYKYKAAKTYIDIKTERVYSDIPALQRAAAELAGLEI